MKVNNVGNKKKIKLEYIAKIQRASIRIFEEEDDSYPNWRSIKANERAIKHYLNKITSDEEEQMKIERCCTKHNFNTSDYTYKPICDDLRALGYEIELGKTN